MLIDDWQVYWAVGIFLDLFLYEAASVLYICDAQTAVCPKKRFVYDSAAVWRHYLSTNVSLNCIHVPEHQVYTYDDSESPRGPTVQLNPSPPDAVSLLSESPQRPNQSSSQRDKGDGEQRERERERAPDEQEEQLKLSRCLSDPGPNKEEEDGGDGSFKSWWSTLWSCWKQEDDWWSPRVVGCTQWVVAKLDIY